MDRWGVSKLRARNLTRGIVAIGVLAATLPLAASASASAMAVGTFTVITAPAKDLTYHSTLGVTNTLTVSGQASLDVTSVDIVCTTAIFDGARSVSTLATNVAVTAGHFTTIAFCPRARLRPVG